MESGYPAWLLLKAALDVPYVEDLFQVDGIQLDAFRTNFSKEGLAFEEECRKMINKLAQEIVIWAHCVAEAHIGVKLDNIWTADSLPSICVDLLKEFGVNLPDVTKVEDAYKYCCPFSTILV